MHWLMTTDVRRYQGRHRSSGHVWQGRFTAFPIQEEVWSTAFAPADGRDLGPGIDHQDHLKCAVNVEI